MLDLQQIQQFFPPKVVSAKSSIYREYLQYKILEYLFASSCSKKLCFIGGTALRIAYQIERFSEDLDFDNVSLTEKEFDDLMVFLQNKLKKEGFQVEIRTVHKGAFHCYIKFCNVLYDNQISPLKDEKMLIRIDSFDQGYDFEPERVMLNKFDVFTQIYVAPMSLLLSQKLFTITERKRSKGRDFFDILFLMGRNVKPDYKFLEQKINVSNDKQLKNYLFKTCENFNFKRLYDDVKPFLWNSDDRRVEKFLEYVEVYGF